VGGGVGCWGVGGVVGGRVGFGVFGGGWLLGGEGRLLLMTLIGTEAWVSEGSRATPGGKNEKIRYRLLDF